MVQLHGPHPCVCSAGGDATQAQLFNDFSFIVDAALDGYNGAVLAYGASYYSCLLPWHSYDRQPRCSTPLIKLHPLKATSSFLPWITQVGFICYRCIFEFATVMHLAGQTGAGKTHTLFVSERVHMLILPVVSTRCRVTAGHAHPALPLQCKYVDLAFPCT